MRTRSPWKSDIPNKYFLINFYVLDNLQESNKMRRGDVTWQYGTKVNDKRRVRCNFYGKEMGGGIYRLKEHLAWIKGNVTGCKEVPADVKQQMLKLITKGKGKTVQRERDAEEIGRGCESPIDEEDDQEVEFEAKIERAKIASLQEHNYRQIEIQEIYGRRDGAFSSSQPQEHVIPGRGGCGPSLLKFTSSRLKRSFSNHPSSYSRPSTTQRHEPIDVRIMTRWT
ncbi:hypothetical protein AMTRI_Chr10g3170 [Amborella trichopoda]